MTSHEFTAILDSARILARKLRPTKTATLVSQVQQYLVENSINVDQVATAMFILGSSINLDPFEILNLIDIVDLHEPPECQYYPDGEPKYPPED